MTKYRKKPVVIEAWQFNGNMVGHPLWLEQAWMAGKVMQAPSGGNALVIKTLEGDHRADMGDFIIQGVKGELYPCKPDIFAATYEPAEA